MRQRIGRLGIVLCSATALLLLAACDGGNAPAACEASSEGCFNPQVAVAPPVPKHVVISTGGRMYTGGMTNPADGMLDTPAAAQTKLSLSAPLPETGALGSGTKASESVTVGVPRVGAYVVDRPIENRTPARYDHEVLAVTNAGELLVQEKNIDYYDYSPAKKIDPAVANSDAIVRVWAPQQSVADGVQVLQHRKGSAGTVRYDAVRDQLLFIETTADGRVLKRRGFDGAEEVLATSGNDVLDWAQNGSGYYYGYSQNTGPIQNDVVLLCSSDRCLLVNLAGKTTQDVLDTKNVQSINDLSLPGHPLWLLKSAEHTTLVRGDGKQVELPKAPEGYAVLAGQAVFRLPLNDDLVAIAQSLQASESSEKVVNHYVILSLATGAPIATLPELTAAPLGVGELLGGPKLETHLTAVLAKLDEAYVVGLEDRLCAVAVGPQTDGVDCETVRYHIALRRADGGTQPILSADWPLSPVMGDAASRRMVILENTQSAWQRLTAVAIDTGEVLARLEDVALASAQSLGASAGGEWEHKQFIFVKQPTTRAGEVALGVLGIQTLRDLAAGGTLAVAPIVESIPDSGLHLWIADRGAVRAAAIVADTTVLPELDVCGDGKKTGAEACDDGNTVDGDTCSANCSTVTTPAAAITLTFTKPAGLAPNTPLENKTSTCTLTVPGSILSQQFALKYVK